MAFTAGQRVTADALNAEFNRDRMVTQDADQTVNNSAVLVSSNYLILSVEANSSYVFSAFLIHTGPTTADFKYNLLLPSGALVRQGTWTPVAAVSSTNTTIAIDALDASTYNSGDLGTGTMVTMRPTGLVVVSTTAGDAVVQFAQGSAVATDTVLKTGSWMNLVKRG